MANFRADIFYLMIFVIVLGNTACAAPLPMIPQTAQTILVEAWQADQNAVWEIKWEAMPIGGAVVAETWRMGKKYRLEILESAAPALIGETLIFDGQQGWQYNRLAESVTPMPSFTLSPVTDAFGMIDQLLTTPPKTACQQQTSLLDGAKSRPAQEITLIFENNSKQLTFWLDPKTKLPLQIKFVIKGQEGWLKARRSEPLIHPPDGLFKKRLFP